MIGVLAALRRRDETGEGEWVDMALLDAQVGVLANQALNYFVTGKTPKRLGNAHPNIVPYQVFPAGDGHLIIAVGNDGQYKRLCGVLGRPELADDPKFATNAARVASRTELVAILTEETAARARDDLLAALEMEGVPAGPINSVQDVFEDKQINHREMKVDLPATDVEGGSVTSVRTPIRFKNGSLVLERAAPALGEHTAEILAELGLTDKG